MIANSFVQWCQTASAAERCSAVEFLADSLISRSFPENELRQVEAMLVLALDDPSPKVRLAIALKVKHSERICRRILRVLARDVESVASVVVAHSPQLTDADLIELLCCETPHLQAAIAGRRIVSTELASALAACGTAEACLHLLGNDGAVLNKGALSQIAERFGDHGTLRAALLQRCDLPPELRHELIQELGRALLAFPLVRGSLGSDRARRIVFEAGEEAASQIIEDIGADCMPRFAEQLRSAGQLSVATLVRAACAGNIDFFAAALVSLCDQTPKRVRAILVDGREAAFAALMRACGLPDVTTPLFLSAVQIWKELSAEAVRSDPREVAASVIDRVVLNFRASGNEQGFRELETYLRQLSSRASRLGLRAVAERRLAA